MLKRTLHANCCKMLQVVFVNGINSKFQRIKLQEIYKAHVDKKTLNIFYPDTSDSHFYLIYYFTYYK